MLIQWGLIKRKYPVRPAFAVQRQLECEGLYAAQSRYMYVTLLTSSDMKGKSLTPSLSRRSGSPRPLPLVGWCIERSWSSGRSKSHGLSPADCCCAVRGSDCWRTQNSGSKVLDQCWIEVDLAVFSICGTRTKYSSKNLDNKVIHQIFNA